MKNKRRDRHRPGTEDRRTSGKAYLLCVGTVRTLSSKGPSLTLPTGQGCDKRHGDRVSDVYELCVVWVCLCASDLSQPSASQDPKQVADAASSSGHTQIVPGRGPTTHQRRSIQTVQTLGGITVRCGAVRLT